VPIYDGKFPFSTNTDWLETRRIFYHSENERVGVADRGPWRVTISTKIAAAK